MTTAELQQTQTKANILPFYMVIDVSYSMSVDGKIDSANGIIDELTVALSEQPVIADKVRFGVIDFSDEAQIALPLCDLSMTPAPPPFSVRGLTSYVAAFQRLREQIEKDVAQLKADGFAVHRPAVFFISDGEPTDEDDAWRQAFAELTSYDKESKTGFPYFPNVIPFGIGATPETLRDLIHPRDRSRAYFMKDGANAGKALAEMAQILIASTMLSGASFGNGGPGFVLPAESDMGENVEAADYEDLL